MIYQVHISTSAVMILEIEESSIGLFCFWKGTSTSLIYKKNYQQTIKGVDVPRVEQPALTTVSKGVVPFTKKVLVSECCGERCGSILIPNVYALNRTRTNQARINCLIIIDFILLSYFLFRFGLK
jgi:hypothetical protein